VAGHTEYIGTRDNIRNIETTHQDQELQLDEELQLEFFSYLAGMSPYISLKIKKRRYEHHMIEAHK
jgi:hypothetical protein